MTVILGGGQNVSSQRRTVESVPDKTMDREPIASADHHLTHRFFMEAKRRQHHAPLLDAIHRRWTIEELEFVQFGVPLLRRTRAIEQHQTELRGELGFGAGRDRKHDRLKTPSGSSQEPLIRDASSPIRPLAI
jgi:hypothetical protein